jgi:hypothetical protein
MAKKHTPIAALMDAFGGRSEFAAAVGTNVANVHKWAQNNRIPADWQDAAVRAAQMRGLSHITAEWMLAMHAREARAA